MNKFKKIIAFLLTFIMTSSSIVFAEFNDLEGNSYADEISFMYQIGVLNGYTETMFSPEQQFTRAEFLLALMRLTKTINFAESIEPEVTEEGVKEDESVYHYTDVAPHYIADYINSAYTYGIVDASDGPEFRPDDKITRPEAMKWMVRALGYGKVLPATSDSGVYTKMANDMDLLEGVKFSLTTGIRRDEGSALLFNMLTAPLCNAGYDPNGRFDTIKSEKTLIEDYYKLQKIEGVVMSYNEMSLSSTVGAASGRIVIGTSAFANATMGMENILGSKVTAYYSKVDGIDTVQIIIKKDNPSMQLTDADDYKFNASVSQYEYYVDGRSKTAKVNTNAYVVFNGAPVIDMTTDVMRPSIGNVRLIDNDSDSKYDVVIVQSVENYYVDSINAGEMIIADENGRTVCLDPGNGQNESVVLTDTLGEEKMFEDIAIGNVVSVMVSKGTSNKLIRAYVSTTTISGTIGMVSDENGKKILTVNGEKHPIDMVSVTNTAALLGRRATLYLDMYGNVAYIKLTGTEYIYTYIIKGMYEVGTDYVALQLLMGDSGNIETLELADKVNLDGTTINKTDIIKDTRVYHSGAEKFYQQLIKVKINADNKITFIDLPTNNTGKYSGFDRTEFTLDYSAKSTYRNSFLIADKFILNKTTPVFRVPEQNLDGQVGENVEEKDKFKNETDLKYFKVMTKSIIATNASHQFALYDLNDSREPAVCVLYQMNAGGSYIGRTYAKLITPIKVGQKVNDDNIIVKFVGYYNESGVYTELSFAEDCSDDLSTTNTRLHDYLKDTYTVDDIDVGFSFRAQTNASGEINNFRVHFDPILSRDANGELIYYEGGDRNDENNRYTVSATSMYFHTIYNAVGEIREVDYNKSVIFNAHKVDPSDITDSNRAYIDEDGFDVRYNRTFWKQSFMCGAKEITIVENGKYRVGAWTDLAVGDKVYARAYRAEPLEFVIFR